MDNEPKVPKPYKVCMRDEIQNHKYAIEDYEKEISLIKTPQPHEVEIKISTSKS